MLSVFVTGINAATPGSYAEVEIPRLRLTSSFDICTDTRYGRRMSKTFRHNGLKRLFENDDPSGVRADQVKRIRGVLASLDQAQHPNDLALPGYRLHPLRGELKGHWSVTIFGNWRISFRFEGGDALDVDLVDYH